MEEKERKCSACKKTLHITEFGGEFKTCILCRKKGKEYCDSHKNQISSRFKIWYENNKEDRGEKVKEYQKMYYSNNRKVILCHQKEYYNSNSRKIKARVKKYKEKNSENIAIRTKMWRDKNTEYRKEYRELYKDKGKVLMKKERDQLHDRYVRGLISKEHKLSFNHITNEMVEAKRKQLQIHRNIKEIHSLIND